MSMTGAIISLIIVKSPCGYLSRCNRSTISPLANHIPGYILAEAIRLHGKYNLLLSIQSQIKVNLIYVIENICQN